MSAIKIAQIFFFQFALTKAPTETSKWVLCGISVVIGLLFGWLAIKFKKLGFFLAGSLLGFVLASVLYNTFVFRIKINPPEVKFESIKYTIK